MDYTIEKLRAKWDEYPDISICLGPGETGWAKDLGGGLAALANIPLAPGLGFMDVVRLEPSGGGSRKFKVGEIVWRAYAKKTGVEYPAPDEETARKNFNAIHEACIAAGLITEGIVEGSCGVSHHEDTDLKAVLAAGGVDTSGITLRSDW